MRKLMAAGSGVAAILAITGCTPQFFGPIQGKQISEKKVQIKFKICIRDLENPDECEPPGSARANRGGGPYRHLLAFRVPKGTKMRETFRSRDGEVSYERNGSYARELKELAPTPAGTKWFGFTSELIGADDPNRARYRIRFRLPDDSGDLFKYRPVTGYGLAEDPVECGDDAFDPSDESDSNTVCISDPEKRKQVRRSKKIRLD